MRIEDEAKELEERLQLLN